MEDESQPVINIEASLINVQRGDVMILKYPDGMIRLQKENTTTIIRDMLLANGIDIPVLTFPKDWDVMMIEKNEMKKWQNTCWFCRKDKTDSFDSEFDTYLHIACLKDALEKEPDHPEAKHMKYLLKDDDPFEYHKDTRCNKNRCACDYYNGYEFDNKNERMEIKYDYTQETTKEKFRK